MDDKLYLSQLDCRGMAIKLVRAVRNTDISEDVPLRVYGVPRGGVPVAYLVQALSDPRTVTVDTPGESNLIVDDLVDSGATKKKYQGLLPSRPFYALCDYLPLRKPGQWIVFPWEHGEGVDQSADDIVLRLLQYIGEDPKREGLQNTPQRFLRAWKHWTSGYSLKPVDIIKTFEDGGENYDEMVFQKDLPFYSQCEHHLAPFFGTATIAYIPDKKVVGLSKLHRVLDVFARRLQVQERLTVQVADALHNALEPIGVGVMLKARHLCMESRGIGVQGHYTVTSALRGKFLLDPTVRAEFLSIAQ